MSDPLDRAEIEIGVGLLDSVLKVSGEEARFQFGFLDDRMIFS
ncbi:MAG TPA: hypothetical protein PKD76_04705 [Solirubrobacterales bacterium]|nr:hypothetical protein [Solirubrobacterales bacterium]